MKYAKELNEVIDNGFGLLKSVLVEAAEIGGEWDYRTKFVYRHARNINQLGHDVLFLMESGRLESCQVIVRAMLESLFKLIAAVKQPEAALQIFISELEADAERMKLLNPIECAPGVECFESFAAKLRKEHNVTSEKEWSTFACADAAELIDKYRGEYFIFSGRSHASTGGIILEEGKIGAGCALQTLLFIVIYASGGFVQVIQTKTPQRHVDESARLLNKLLELMEAGIFKEVIPDLDES
jgi:hypothetical protein